MWNYRDLTWAVWYVFDSTWCYRPPCLKAYAFNATMNVFHNISLIWIPSFFHKRFFTVLFNVQLKGSEATTATDQGKNYEGIINTLAFFNHSKAASTQGILYSRIFARSPGQFIFLADIWAWVLQATEIWGLIFRIWDQKVDTAMMMRMSPFISTLHTISGFFPEKDLKGKITTMSRIIVMLWGNS